MNDPNTTQQTEFVWRRLLDSLHFLGKEVDGRVWLAFLIPILILGFVYAVWMYVRDSRSVGWAWAAFMGALRCTVYAILALVFLLPANQSWDETKMQSRVVSLFDVSESTTARDDLPSDATPVEKLPTRQDKVIAFLGDEKAAFLKRLMERNPVYAYRWGGQLDEDFFLFDSGQTWSRAEWEERLRNADNKQVTLPEGKVWGVADWNTWLRPEIKPVPEDLDEEGRAKFQKRQELMSRLLKATNMGDSVLTALNREINNMVQGVIVFSDGHSTEGSPQAFRDLADRAKKAKVPIFVVAVGQDRPPVKIDISDVQVPEQARPEDRFPVRVLLNGEGLAGQTVTVFLDIFKPGAKDKCLELQENATFKPGEPPSAQVEFTIEAAKYPEALKAASEDKSAKPELEEGEWRFVARVAKNKQEVFVPKEHVSDAAPVRIVKRPLRVLLFASAPLHDYQFIRTLFVREMDKSRAELCIYMQPAPGHTRSLGVVQDVPPERLLTAFPNALRDENEVKADDKFYNLAAYDLIIAFDPDWTQLTEEQCRLVERWVGTHAGGLILIGGPINTFQLARPGAGKEKLRPILDLYPVVLQDNRILNLERDPKDPWRLNFPGATPEMEFLKLDEESKDQMLAGWEEFFTGKTRAESANSPTLRGIYNYYPVEKAKDAATVVATLSDPRSRLVDTNKEQPWLVTMPYGGGKVVWISSGETRRLRAFRESYFERFWTKLARFAGSGNLTRLNRRIVMVMGRTFNANNYVNIEAQIFARDMTPLPANAKPQVVVKLPAGVSDKEVTTKIDLTAKPGGEWNGWFNGRFLVKQPGEYGVDLKVPETGDTESRKFTVKESNPELDNTRPDFAALYNLASEADDVFARMTDRSTATAVRQYLQQQRPGQAADKPEKADKPAANAESEKLRLFFDLKGAALIPDCMVSMSNIQRSRGAVQDLWDKGYVTIKEADPPQQPVKLVTVLTVIVVLLGAEWLTRKLLRLA